MSPAADAVIRRLDGVRQQWWMFTLLTTAVWAVCISMAILLAFLLGDAYLMFAQPTLVGFLLVWLVITGGLVFLVGRRLLRGQRGIEATARRVEFECPELGSTLMNVVQLASDTANVNRAFCEAAVNEAASKAAGFRFEQAAARETRWGRFRSCMQTPRDLLESLAVLGLLIGAAIACQMYIPNWGSAASRLMSPWDFIPSIGSVGEIKVTPGDTEVLDGSTLEIKAQIKGAEDKTPAGSIYLLAEDRKSEEERALSADQQHRTFSIALPSLTKSFKYRIQIGDSQTRLFNVQVMQKPTFSEVEVTFRYPPYLGKANETFTQKTADLEAPQCTEAELRIHPTVPVAKVFMQTEGKRTIGAVEGDGNLAILRVPMIRDGSFTVHLITEGGHSDPDPRLNRMRVLPDRPPAVQLLKPALSSTVFPGGDVAVSLRASDDHAVGRVRLEMKIEKAPDSAEAAEKATAEKTDGPMKVVQEWQRFEGTTNVLLGHRLALPAETVHAGDVVRIRAVAWDKRMFNDWGENLKPQEAASPWHAIRVIAEETKLAQTLEELDNVRNMIFRILEQQIAARVKAADILHRAQAAERIAQAGDVRGQQVSIQKAGAAVVGAIGQSDKPERLEIKRAMNALAVGEMVEAVRKCDALTKIKTAEAFANPVPGLTAVQDRIIDVLRKMLNEARRAQTEALAEAKKRAVGDMPNDVKQKLQDAKDKLDEFLKQQKKVIEATKDLAKKHVEDFTDQEEEILKGLKAAEDEWAKLMEDLKSDLSKLPEQDFANASMAKELNEIQTQLKMAEDALTKKSADIAVPLEQLGYEKAQELTTNMEKWLPDTPDREKWSQEEALSDADKEAPMAELPSELEDLIGELMEEEEDIMNEAEDVSSSAIDSADKGVGWDASDGPISDNSAKGVTGNRLPNTSEIGGRSGEGRSGKSSGEFVGDEAVGKGGRKTPSRLTPDPFVKGQIQDHSKDAQGGATGGGKESGQGGEGLEGPAPRSPGDRDMARLAGKQAALRNKAEGVDVQFQVQGYHRTDLTNLIDIMSQMERDLSAGRYQNVLRQRQVIAEKMGNVKQYLKGEFQVKQDATANLPADIQKELLGAMQEPAPAGWEAINREYFERLSGGSMGGDSGIDAAKPAAK